MLYETAGRLILPINQHHGHCRGITSLECPRRKNQWKKVGRYQVPDREVAYRKLGVHVQQKQMMVAVAYKLRYLHRWNGFARQLDHTQHPGGSPTHYRLVEGNLNQNVRLGSRIRRLEHGSSPEPC